MTLDLEKIVKACQRRESRAQRELYEQFAPKMLGVCMRYVHSRDEAQDVLQDGFIKIFEGIGGLNDWAKVEHWMRRIMINKSLEYLVTHNAVVYCDLQEWDQQNNPAIKPQEPTFDTDGYEVWMVMAALGKLKVQYRTAFNMRVVDEMEYGEIAERLGVPESTVRCWVCRACQQLKELLMDKIF